MIRINRRNFLKVMAASLLLYNIVGSVRSYSVEVVRLNLGVGRRILFLPDIHAHGGDRSEVIRLAGSIKPDIVILGGDMWDRLTRSWGYIEELVRGLRRSSSHVVAVLGNHEYNADSTGRIRLGEALTTLENLGIAVLRDDKVDLAGLTMAGLDWRSNPRRYDEAARRLGRADIVVSHSPDAFPHLAQGQPLLLAGHTHGGQICLPGGRSLWTNSAYGYTHGVYRVRGRIMVLSRGVGEMVPPRLYCGRQAHLIS